MIKGYSYRCLLAAIVRKFRNVCSDLFWRICNGLTIWMVGAKHGKHLRVRGRCEILIRTPNDVVFGDRVIVESRSGINYAGLTGHAILHTLYGGRISIGDDTGMSAPIISSRSSVMIGKRCRIGGNVRIFDHDFHPLDPILRASTEDVRHIQTKPVEIDNDVFIGVNAIILKGTRLGARTIVAAGSVVFGLDAPPDSMVKGNPAAVVLTRDNM